MPALSRHPASPEHGSPGGGTSATPPPGNGPEPGARLNLLLSDAGWEPETWADQLPRLLEPMGISAIRARSAQQASLVIESTPIHVAVVDLALPLNDLPAPERARTIPNEAGPRLLELLMRLENPPPIVVLKRPRTVREGHRDIAGALRAGAFAVLDRPRDSRGIELVLETLRRAMHRYYHDRWPAP